MTPVERSQRVKAAAIAAGFTRAGVTTPDPVGASEYVSAWVAAGRAGSMQYLREPRDNPRDLLPGARSVVCVALQYRRRDDGTAAAGGIAGGPTGRVAQYARGMDYHVVLKRKIARMVAALREELGEAFEARACVDTAPVMERQLAARAGLGWIGKNTLLLHPRDGSFCFLGVLITTLELAADGPMTDHCGTCTRCLQACPTGALDAPYEMDASKCVSYLTIEHRAEIAPALRAGIGDWVYGCDVCQDVCPFNARAPFATDPQIAVEKIPARVDLAMLANLTAGDYRRLTRGTSAKRAHKRVWMRNALVALGNMGALPPAMPGQ
jgi:epoxyqueuosine reductase